MNIVYELVKMHREAGGHGLTIPFLFAAVCVDSGVGLVEAEKGMYKLDCEMSDDLISMARGNLVKLLGDKKVPEIFSSFVCGSISARVIGFKPGHEVARKSPEDIWIEFCQFASLETFNENFISKQLKTFRDGAISRYIEPGMKWGWSNSMSNKDAKTIMVLCGKAAKK